MALEQLSYEIRQRIWDGSIPLQIVLAPNECRLMDTVEPYYCNAYRTSYFPLYFDRIISFFKPYLRDPAAAQSPEWWLEFEGVPLKWNLPIGLLYDLLTGLDPTQIDNPNYDWHIPWVLVLHHVDYPTGTLLRLTTSSQMPSVIAQMPSPALAESIQPAIAATAAAVNIPSSSALVKSPSSLSPSPNQSQYGSLGNQSPFSEAIGALVDNWVNRVKEADYIRRGNAKAVMSLSRIDSDALWQGVLNHSFETFWSVAKKLLPQDNRSIRYIPIKLYLPSSNRTLQALVPPYVTPSTTTTSGLSISSSFSSAQATDNSSTLHTIGSALHDHLPELFPSRRTCLLARPVLHGVVLPLSAPLVDIMRNCMYSDGFLHICISMIA
ncbi:autophagy protein Apg5-domain-containing protein [Dipodascopsis uninucleata]